jgi:hypothetical protein
MERKFNILGRVPFIADDVAVAYSVCGSLLNP